MTFAYYRKQSEIIKSFVNDFGDYLFIIAKKKN